MIQDGIPEGLTFDDVLREPLRVAVKIRHRHEPALAMIERSSADEILVTFDREGSIAYLTEGDRTALGLDLPALRQLALTNLQRLLPPLKLDGPGPLFAVEADGNYSPI